MLAVVGTSLASWVWHPGRERHVLTAKSPLVTVNSHVHVHSWSIDQAWVFFTSSNRWYLQCVSVQLEDTRQKITVQRKLDDSGIIFNCDICVFYCSNAWIHTWDFRGKIGTRKRNRCRRDDLILTRINELIKVIYWCVCCDSWVQL